MPFSSVAPRMKRRRRRALRLRLLSLPADAPFDQLPLVRRQRDAEGVRTAVAETDTSIICSSPLRGEYGSCMRPDRIRREGLRNAAHRGGESNGLAALSSCGAFKPSSAAHGTLYSPRRAIQHRRRGQRGNGRHPAIDGSRRQTKTAGVERSARKTVRPLGHISWCIRGVLVQSPSRKETRPIQVRGKPVSRTPAISTYEPFGASTLVGLPSLAAQPNLRPATQVRAERAKRRGQPPAAQTLLDPDAACSSGGGSIRRGSPRREGLRGGKARLIRRPLKISISRPFRAEKHRRTSAGLGEVHRSTTRADHSRLQLESLIRGASEAHRPEPPLPSSAISACAGVSRASVQDLQVSGAGKPRPAARHGTIRQSNSRIRRRHRAADASADRRVRGEELDLVAPGGTFESVTVVPAGSFTEASRS